MLSLIFSQCKKKFYFIGFIFVVSICIPNGGTFIVVVGDTLRSRWNAPNFCQKIIVLFSHLEYEKKLK